MWPKKTPDRLINDDLCDTACSPEDDTPLPEVENIQGWRRVQVLPMGLLASPQQAELMTERLSPIARCLSGFAHLSYAEGGHKPPMHGCCGWHAMYERSTHHGPLVNILVSAIGETWLCREGWIAEQIRVDEVRVPEGFDENLARTIAERYQVPVHTEEESCTSENPSNESSRDQFMNASFSPPQPLGRPPHPGGPNWTTQFNLTNQRLPNPLSFQSGQPRLDLATRVAIDQAIAVGDIERAKRLLGHA